MSTLEKFGILVILILVVIIGVVAVWGVGGKEDNPFASGEVATAEDPAAVPPGTDLKDWPPAAPAPADTATGPVPPPALGAAPAPSAPPPAPAAPTTYKVQAGDTGAKIAQKTLGDANRWPEIARINNNQDARRLKIGQSLNIPSAGTQVASGGGAKPPVVAPNSLVPPVNPADGPTETAPAVPAFREVEVRNGDTLYGISARELGNGDLYFKILKANPGLDPKKLRAGMKVKVPTQ